MRPCSWLAIAFCMAACTDPVPTREWTPADHGQPSNADPERTPQPGDPQAAPDPAQAEARAAQALWNVSCASCHGRSGRGDGPNPPPGATLPDLTTASFQASRDDAQLAEVIRAGRALMPAFGEQINPQGISALVRHVRSLAQPSDGSQ
jgi:cytochrome c oxidase cbb3-type subunit 3